MKYLLSLIRCFRHNEKPPKEIKKEIKQQRVVKLPEEIIAEILFKLPFKYMIQFSCISKRWKYLILHDLQFSKTHYKVASQQKTLSQSLLVPSLTEGPSYDLNFRSIPADVLAGGDRVPKSFLFYPFKENAYDRYSTIQLLGTCNGLVCITKGTYHYTKYETNYYKDVCIWNPSTGFVNNLVETELERNIPSKHGGPTTCTRYILTVCFCSISLLHSAERELQQLHGEICKSLDLISRTITLANSGFGYINSTDDYKYVVLSSVIDSSSPLRFSDKGTKAEIFSLRNKCWRSMDVFPSICCNDQSGFYLNEALHWISVDVVKKKRTITAFDLGTEEFRQMPLPPDSMNTYSLAFATEVLVRLGDCLCLWRSNSQDIQFWVMREYNVDESWDLLYSFRTVDLPANVANRRLQPVFVTESGTFVLKVSDYENKFLIRIECHKEKKPVCSDRHLFKDFLFAAPLWSFDAVQYDQTLL